MRTVRETLTEERGTDIPAGSNAEWAAAALRPVAHWVLMPQGAGRSRLQMVWETPDPLPPRRTT